MHILKTTILSGQQLKDIKALEAACRKHDNYSLTFPIEDGSLYFLLYDEEALLSVFSAYFNGIDTWECSAFTRPADRRKGYFTDLLNHFLEENETEDDNGEFDLVFAVDESCVDTVKTLEAMEAGLWHREHMMELRISDQSKTAGLNIRLADIPITFSPALNARLLSNDSVYRIFSNGCEAGSFHLDFRGDTVYFHGFEIKEPLRGHGLGTSAFSLLLYELRCLTGEKIQTIRLQVSGSNAAALSLYKKAGFQITETVSYYLY